MKENRKENVIKVRGARVHNLKNVDVDIPRDKLVVITGISGSGKSSLAFDTIYAEGQRRYVESLSSYARQFLGVMDKPDVDKIEGISPTIAISQRTISHNPRSTVGTITEIYDYLRVLFARVGKAHCPQCGRPVSRQSIDQIVSQVRKLPQGSEITILGPVIRGRKGEHKGILEEVSRQGFVRVRIDGIIHRTEEAMFLDLDRKKQHTVEVVVDHLDIDDDLDRMRLVDSTETALKIGKGLLVIAMQKPAKKETEDLLFSEHFACEHCGINLPAVEPRLFSFNSPYGACVKCTGLGEQLEVDPSLVIPNPRLSLAEGAIRPWMHASHRVGRQGFYWVQLSDLAERLGFSLRTQAKDLPKDIVQKILYGHEGFEGVIPNLERRYRETDSDWTRSEIEHYMIVKQCPACKGKRLKPEALAVKIHEYTIDKIVETNIENLRNVFRGWASKNSSKEKKVFTVAESNIVEPIVKEILERLEFLAEVGLDYLTLDRKASTLAGGEAQRISLATQIGSRLTGVTYVLDEPSIGLHSRDQARLIKALEELRDVGNTVLVVEHDEQTIRKADWVIDVGPGAGKHGGEIMFEGTPVALLKANTLTGEYLSGRKKVEWKSQHIKQKPSRAKENKVFTKQQPRIEQLIIKGAREHNLKNIDVKIPLGKFVCVTGVSGSGKSTLINDILARAAMRHFYDSKDVPGAHDSIIGFDEINKVAVVDQSPIGRTPRSNPATYTGVFAYIRDLFTETKEAKIRGYGPGRFSFNVKGGRCEACEGQGLKKIEMYFLPDVYVECEVCKGTRYMSEVLEVEHKGKNISQVLHLTVEEAVEFFKGMPGLYHKLKVLHEVGLSYVELGQPAPSLSGGEAQRIKLAEELSKRDTGRTLYILDEPTTGLHFEDVKKLLFVLRELVDKGNTVLVIEHNIDIVKNSDWVIDLGPEGGEKGGRIVAEGTPEDIKKSKESYTGKYL